MSRTKSKTQAKIGYRTVQRIKYAQNFVRYDAFVVCGPEFLNQWQQLGNVLVLVPGLTTYQAIGVQGAPLIINESALCGSAWSGTDGSIGENRLDELEEFAKAIRDAGGVCIDIFRGYRVPDVNLERFRALGDIQVALGESVPRSPEPILIQQIRTVLDTGKMLNSER